ncbi:hypothetical protein ACWOFR_04535 [Carnobacterium gallinarum]|uniref:hypothetical protein n=1 Tax=Carnobacterium gallinarum TaxID=2749 RepID=UPI000AD7E025|nr:hypothetical protein [Carnobacterium gallinarum]
MYKTNFEMIDFGKASAISWSMVLVSTFVTTLAGHTLVKYHFMANRAFFYGDYAVMDDF